MNLARLDTIRWRIILGLSGLFVGLIIAAVVGVTSLATMRIAVVSSPSCLSAPAGDQRSARLA